MFYGSLAFVFELLVYLGIGLPLVNLIISLIGGIGSGSASADIDAEIPAGAELSADLDLDLDLDLDMDIDADFDFADADALSAGGSEAPGASGAPTAGKGFALRFNIYCLCFAFVVMGAFGIFALNSFSGVAQIIMLALGLALALLAYIFLYRFVVYPLKKNKAEAFNMKSLRFRHVAVLSPVTVADVGKIETTDSVGARISYLALLDPDVCKVSRIEAGEKAIITRIDEKQNICYITLNK